MINKKKKTHQRILREVLSAAREERGLSPEALAKVVCLSKWHIKELEEADTFLTFYSMAIKIQAAKRIGHYLGLSEDQYLKCTE
jgi:ribosome-binding protein aMBF1 (putative translation factor)